MIDDYNEMVLGGFFPRQLKPAVEVVVAAGQTVLSPGAVHMAAHIYPRSGLGLIKDNGYWDDYH